MKKSLRRIGNVLVTLSITGLFFGLLSSLSFQCGSGTEGCLANVYWGVQYDTQYASDMMTAVTTSAIPATSFEWTLFIQLVSGYTLLIAVGILIALECVELHYIRRALHLRSKFRFRLF